MNVLSFVGNLGRDAVTKHVGQTTVTEFSVAMSSGWGDKKITTWVKCSYWGRGGEAVEPYLKKGQQAHVIGECGLRTYDKDDGTTGYSFECRVNSLQLVGKREERQEQEEKPAGGFRDKPAEEADVFDDGGDSIPF